jgi:hypothetical protein
MRTNRRNKQKHLMFFSCFRTKNPRLLLARPAGGGRRSQKLAQLRQSPRHSQLAGSKTLPAGAKNAKLAYRLPHPPVPPCPVPTLQPPSMGNSVGGCCDSLGSSNPHGHGHGHGSSSSRHTGGHDGCDDHGHGCDAARNSPTHDSMLCAAAP